jgi:hypothetical protein
MEDMLTFGQLPEFFRYFVITEAYQTTVTFRNLNVARAIHSLSNQGPSIFHETEQPTS